MSLPDKTRTRALIWAGVCFVVLAVLCLVGRFSVDTLHEWDDVLRIGPSTWQDDHPGWYDPLIAISRTFTTIPMVTYALVAGLVFAFKRHHRAAIYVVGGMVTTVVATGLLKAAVGRPRLEDALIVINNNALPSGHSAYIAAAVTSIAILVMIFVRKRPIRRLIISAGVLLALVIGLDRLLLGVHTVTDVTAGYALGVGVALTWAYFFDPAPPLIKAEPLASPVFVDRKLACILNPIKVEDVGAFQSLVEKMAADSGYLKPDWYLTTIEDPGRSMAEQAAISGASLVLVCGGDGTVRTVCGELAGTGIPVGVIPAGTGNLLARNLDLPLYIRSAIDVGLRGQDRAVDLVHIGGDGIPDQEHYLVMAGMGFDAAIMEDANEQLKAKIGAVAYVLSGLKNIMYPTVKVEVSVDDGPWTKHRARTIVIGNVGHLQGGLPLLPDATIDDGVIDLLILFPRRFLSWLRIVARVLRRSPLSDETVTRMTGHKIVVRAERDTPRQIDGDSIGAGREIQCECLPGKLLIRVPR